MKIIYYYQTFVGLQDIFQSDFYPTHIHVSSIHFGLNNDGSNYIHLNNNDPFSSVFNDLWDDLRKATDLGIKIKLMIGGAGGGYHSFFINYTYNYNLLKETITKAQVISGVDLDIEEYTDIENVKMLIRDLKKDFGDAFTISMAPVQSSLQSDNPGMGGFCYKDLYNSDVGSFIDYFNGQFYIDYSVEAYDSCVKNGYPANKIIMGMISSEDFNKVKDVIKELKTKYSNFGGIFNWEYFNSPPSGEKAPNDWCKELSEY